VSSGARAWHYDRDAASKSWKNDRDAHELFERIRETVGEKLGRKLEP
jgi:hypothetical protein